jgi:hypothetical protein
MWLQCRRRAPQVPLPSFLHKGFGRHCDLVTEAAETLRPLNARTSTLEYSVPRRDRFARRTRRCSAFLSIAPISGPLPVSIPRTSRPRELIPVRFPPIHGSSIRPTSRRDRSGSRGAGTLPVPISRALTIEQLTAARPGHRRTEAPPDTNSKLQTGRRSAGDLRLVKRHRPSDKARKAWDRGDPFVLGYLVKTLGHARRSWTPLVGPRILATPRS